MKTNTNSTKFETIMSFVNSNPKCDNAQIVQGTGLGKETVRLSVITLIESGKITFEIVDNRKKVFSAKAEKLKKPAAPKAKKQSIKASVETVLIPSKKVKIKKPAVVQTKFGLGLIYEHEPKVKVQQDRFVEEKVIVHLVKDNMEPRLMNGQPKKILTTMDKVVIITPAAEEVKPARVKREKGEKREKGDSVKDFSKFKFGKELFSKGRLVLAVIKKYAEEHNPTLLELQHAFPDSVVRPYGKGLFVPVVDAKTINEESKRTRFFTKDDEIVKIKGTKIAISNQIDGELVKRLLTVTIKHGYKITQETPEVALTAADSII